MRILALVLLLTRPSLAFAAQQTQPASPPPLTIQEAVRRALDNYPAVRAALENLAAAQSGVDLARTTYLSQGDARQPFYALDDALLVCRAERSQGIGQSP